MSICLKCSKSLSKRQKYYCSNECKLTHSDSISKRTKPKEKQDSNKQVVCKLDGKKFSDIGNYSGVLTRHLKSLEVITDNVLDYYDIVDKVVVNKPKWNCKYCNWKTVDVGNKSGCITVHIKSHGITVENHIKKYPEDEKLWIYNPTKEVAQFLLSKNPDSSKSEEEIYDFIISNKITVVKSDRNLIRPLELDLYLPDYKIAIEVNGLYWHSEYHGKKHRNYHLNKLEACEKAGIRLVHIFEDEWKSKSDIIKSKLLSILGLSTKRVHARNCVLKEVDRRDKSEFLSKNHIQSDDKASIVLGLYSKDELVAVMTFGELRRALGSKKEAGHYELIRFCTSCNVIGGASKLLSYFVKTYKPKAIISYADRRFTTTLKDNLYDRIGFKLVGKTKPNYWYTKDFNKKLHRYNFNKGRLIKEFGADSNKSETQIMYELGYDRIWDCGNLKYCLKV